MKTTRDFEVDGSRYRYDFGACSYSKGFAQVDTGQDAYYFGTWCNPVTLQIVSYCEGDVTSQQAESVSEFTEELQRIKRWNEENGHAFLGIDPGLGDDMRRRFNELSLTDLLH